MDPDEILEEYMKEVRQIRRYYMKLHYVDLNIYTADQYYDSLLDDSYFQPPKDTTVERANEQAGLSPISAGMLKFKSWFSEEAKAELSEKKAKSIESQKQFQAERKERIKAMKERFLEKQKEKNDNIEQRRSAFYNGSDTEITEYLYSLMENDTIILDYAGTVRYSTQPDILKCSTQEKKITIEIKIPNSEDICTIQSFQIKEDGGVYPIECKKEITTKTRLGVAYKLLLRTAILVFNSSAGDFLDELTITGVLVFFDRAIGNYTTLPVIRYRITKELYSSLNLVNMNVSLLFEKKLNAKKSSGLYEKDPIDLKAIK